MASPFTFTAPPYRMLTEADAATYAGFPSSKRFRDNCPVPAVQLAPGVRRWDVRDLDVWLDGLKDGTDATADAVLAKLG